MMSRNDKVRIAYGLVILALIFMMLGIFGQIETHYAIKGKVIKSIGNEYYIEDMTGMIYSFYGDNYDIGDDVKITFDTMLTETREDDEVIKVKVLK